MKIHRPAPLTGPYALFTAPPIDPGRLAPVVVGMVRIAAGTRSPETGMRTSAQHEIGYVVRGRLRLATAQHSQEASTGDVLITSPAEPHSTTAIEDSEIFFVLLDPHLAGQA